MTTPRNKKTNTHGGPRPGAGAKPRDPAAGTRRMWSGRLHPRTLATLKRLQDELESVDGRRRSAAEIIDDAVAHKAEHHFGMGGVS